MKYSLNEDDNINVTNNEVKVMEEETENHYYGLSMIFDYILYNFDENKKYKENNVDKAINYFENIITEIENNTLFGIVDIQLFLDKLFENIKTNKKHNNIVQSIKLIKNLLIEIEDNFDDYQESVLKNLNEKYDIL